jgi:hypothetical protein
LYEVEHDGDAFFVNLPDELLERVRAAVVGLDGVRQVTDHRDGCHERRPRAE